MALGVRGRAFLAGKRRVRSVRPPLRRAERRDRLERVTVGDIALDANRAAAELVGGQRSMTAMFASS